VSKWRWLAQFPLYALCGAWAALGTSGAMDAPLTWTGAMLFALLALGAGRAARKSEEAMRLRTEFRGIDLIPRRQGRSKSQVPGRRVA
jgi:hypothetical protein